MYKIKKITAAVIAITLLFLPVVVYAATQYPKEGGVWEYGNGFAKAYSYYTVDKVHGSSIYKDGVAISVSARTAANMKSIAEKWHVPGVGGYTYYYNID